MAIMIGAARGFLTAGIAYGILGILVGLHMAVGHDHGQRPTHAHILVIGWVSFFLFGLFYLHFGDAVRRWLTILHFWLAQLAMLGLTVGLWLLYSGKPQYEAIAAVSSIAYGVSFLVFAAAALPVLWRRND
ncbi:MAG: hypothetical protein R3D68_09275 [Hyphomicrobiaceae bacterium]